MLKRTIFLEALIAWRSEGLRAFGKLNIYLENEWTERISLFVKCVANKIGFYSVLLWVLAPVIRKFQALGE